MIEKNLIEEKLEKAQQRINEALVLLDNGFYDSVVSRLYYALFYSAMSCLLSENIITKTHSGTKNKFHLHFVKEELISKKTGALLDLLFNSRSEADYGDFVIYKKEEVAPLINETTDAVNEIMEFIKNKMN